MPDRTPKKPREADVMTFAEWRRSNSGTRADYENYCNELARAAERANRSERYAVVPKSLKLSELADFAAKHGVPPQAQLTIVRRHLAGTRAEEHEMRLVWGPTKIVRINGRAFRVPADELTDPDNYADELPEGSETCGALEPEPYGVAVCTLAPHGADVMHIAHDGQWNVLAMWGDPVAPPGVAYYDDEEE